MSDTITRKNLDERVENLNHRMESRGSLIRYQIEGRNGYTAIDRYDTDGRCLSTVRVGTKREVGEFLHAMMVALDDSIFSEVAAVAEP